MCLHNVCCEKYVACDNNNKIITNNKKLVFEKEKERRKKLGQLLHFQVLALQSGPNF